MSNVEEVQSMLCKKLPIELVNKIIYNYKCVRTPSCKVMRKFLEVVKHKFHKFDDITSIKLRILNPKKLLLVQNHEEWEQYYDVDDKVNKMIIVTYNIPNITFKKVFRRRIYLFT